VVAHVFVLDFGEVGDARDDDGAPAEGFACYLLLVRGSLFIEISRGTYRSHRYMPAWDGLQR
jgi:hypothetical protein